LIAAFIDGPIASRLGLLWSGCEKARQASLVTAMIKCTTCELTRERFLHRHQVNPEHQAKMYLRETCADKFSCKFEIIPDELNSEDLLKAQSSRSLL
jgi:hypothetical protein